MACRVPRHVAKRQSVVSGCHSASGPRAARRGPIASAPIVRFGLVPNSSDQLYIIPISTSHRVWRIILSLLAVQGGGETAPSELSDATSCLSIIEPVPTERRCHLTTASATGAVHAIHNLYYCLLEPLGHLEAERVPMKFPQFDQQIAAQMLGAAKSAGGISAYLGFRHVELGAGRSVTEMEVRDELLTPFGKLHGGCLSAMVDHCLGVVFYPVIPIGSWVATTEFKVNLLRPVADGVCVATTEIIAMTKRSGVARIDITNHGRAVSAAQGTVTIVREEGDNS